MWLQLDNQVLDMSRVENNGVLNMRTCKFKEGMKEIAQKEKNSYTTQVRIALYTYA